MGLVCGGALVSALRSLKGRQVSSLVRNEDFAGLVGKVELPFDENSKGKVILEVGGSTLHLVAQTDEKKSLWSWRVCFGSRPYEQPALGGFIRRQL